MRFGRARAAAAAPRLFFPGGVFGRFPPVKYPRKDLKEKRGAPPPVIIRFSNALVPPFHLSLRVHHFTASHFATPRAGAARPFFPRGRFRGCFPPAKSPRKDLKEKTGAAAGRAPTAPRRGAPARRPLFDLRFSHVTLHPSAQFECILTFNRMFVRAWHRTRIFGQCPPRVQCDEDATACKALLFIFFYFVF